MSATPIHSLHSRTNLFSSALHERATFMFILIVFSQFFISCADYPVPAMAHSLDYLEFHDPSGWILRIDGDGGGRLACRSMPGRKVVFLPATFHLGQTERRVQKCHTGISITSPSCLRAIYFSQSSNDTYICYCPDANWAKSYFEHAFAELRHSPGQRKDRRMLQKAWIMSPPICAVVD